MEASEPTALVLGENNRCEKTKNSQSIPKANPKVDFIHNLSSAFLLLVVVVCILQQGYISGPIH